MSNSIIYFLSQLVRYLGDFVHTYTLILLIFKIRQTRSCSGLSYKTQLLYLLIFITRYFDLLYHNVSTYLRLYNFIMKIVYISLQSFIIYLIRVKYFYTYEKRSDSFPLLYIIAPCVILAFAFKNSTRSLPAYILEYSWTFSLFVESVAILPQLVFLQDSGEAEVLTSRYVFCLGVYRLLYVIGWFLKKAVGIKIELILMLCGLLQTILYADFFVLYYKYIFSRRDKTDKIPY